MSLHNLTTMTRSPKHNLLEKIRYEIEIIKFKQNVQIQLYMFSNLSVSD